MPSDLVEQREERLRRGVPVREELRLGDRPEATAVGLVGHPVLGQGLGRVLDCQRLATDPDGGPFAGEFWEGDDGELDLPPLQAALREAERVYNGVRPHQALGYRPPIASLATLPPPHL